MSPVIITIIILFTLFYSSQVRRKSTVLADNHCANRVFVYYRSNNNCCRKGCVARRRRSRRRKKRKRSRDHGFVLIFRYRVNLTHWYATTVTETRANVIDLTYEVFENPTSWYHSVEKRSLMHPSQKQKLSSRDGLYDKRINTKIRLVLLSSATNVHKHNSY